MTIRPGPFACSGQDNHTNDGNMIRVLNCECKTYKISDSASQQSRLSQKLKSSNTKSLSGSHSINCFLMGVPVQR